MRFNTCARGESNPRLSRGRGLCYHYTTSASRTLLLIAVANPFREGSVRADSGLMTSADNLCICCLESGENTLFWNLTLRRQQLNLERGELQDATVSGGGEQGEGATEVTEGNTGETMQKGKAKAPTHKQRRPAPQDQSSTCPTATGRSTKALLRV